MIDYPNETQPLEAAPIAPNGAAADFTHPPPAPAGPAPALVIGRRVQWLPRREDKSDMANHFRAAYPGFQFEAWTNFSREVGQLLNSDADELKEESEKRFRRAFGRIVLRHNGWHIADEETGQPVLLPSPATDEFWQLIPTELSTAIVQLVMTEASALPNSMSGPRANSRRG